MYCIQCGQLLAEDDRFCHRCGAPVTPVLTALTLDPEFSENTEIVDTTVPENEELIETPATKKPRQWLAIAVLALIFVFGLLVFMMTRTDSTPIVSNATPWFVLQDGVLYFDKDHYTGDTTLVVPETINGHAITALSDNCFANCTDLIYIQLPETILQIGDHAFYGCTNLRGVRLPETLVSLGDEAFGNCAGLEAVCIPYSLQNFGKNPFIGCDKLMYFFYPAPISYWYQLPLGEFPEDASVYCADGIYPAA